jgi:hypothetical protein
VMTFISFRTLIVWAHVLVSFRSEQFARETYPKSYFCIHPRNHPRSHLHVGTHLGSLHVDGYVNGNVDGNAWMVCTWMDT